MINKTNLKKYLRAIKKWNQKVMTCEDLVEVTGTKMEKIKDDLSLFYPLINFDPDFNIKDIEQNLAEKLEILEKQNPVKTNERILKRNEADRYKGIIDYIYQNMTFAGGLLNTGYIISKRDVKILKKLVKSEYDKLYKKRKK